MCICMHMYVFRWKDGKERRERKTACINGYDWTEGGLKDGRHAYQLSSPTSNSGAKKDLRQASRPTPVGAFCFVFVFFFLAAFAFTASERASVCAFVLHAFSLSPALLSWCVFGSKDAGVASTLSLSVSGVRGEV